MSKHINLLLKLVEIMVGRGFAETEEGGHDLGLIWYYQGYVTYNGVVYSVRYYTGKYNGESPTIEMSLPDGVGAEFTFDATEKTPVSLSIHRAFEETFTSVHPDHKETK